jgi:hypothetical protein
MYLKLSIELNSRLDPGWRSCRPQLNGSLAAMVASLCNDASAQNQPIADQPMQQVMANCLDYSTFMRDRAMVCLCR